MGRATARALAQRDGGRGTEVVPDPSEVLPADAEIVLIGTAEAEKRFLELYGRGRAASG